MQHSKRLRTAILSLAIATPGLVMAEAGISTCSLPCTAGIADINNDVNLEVNVPEMLIFKVGDKEEVINTISWTLSPTDYAPLKSDASYAGNVPFTSADFDAPAASDDETDSPSDGVLNVYAFGNSGNINIAAASSNGDTLENATGETIPLADFDVTGDSHPSGTAGGLNNGTNGVVTAALNVAELETTWTYAYSPSTTPAAGVYETVITYTASMP